MKYKYAVGDHVVYVPRHATSRIHKAGWQGVIKAVSEDANEPYYIVDFPNEKDNGCFEVNLDPFACSNE